MPHTGWYIHITVVLMDTLQARLHCSIFRQFGSHATPSKLWVSSNWPQLTHHLMMHLLYWQPSQPIPGQRTVLFLAASIVRSVLPSYIGDSTMPYLANGDMQRHSPASLLCPQHNNTCPSNQYWVLIQPSQPSWSDALICCGSFKFGGIQFRTKTNLPWLFLTVTWSICTMPSSA